MKNKLLIGLSLILLSISTSYAEKMVVPDSQPIENIKISNKIIDSDNRPSLNSPDMSKVPDILQKWVPWVTRYNQENECPELNICAFLPNLTLLQNNSEVIFDFKGMNYLNNNLVALPYTNELWPNKVILNNKEAIVVEKEGMPYIQTKKGELFIQAFYSLKKFNQQKEIVLPFTPISYFNNNMKVYLEGNTLLLGNNKKILDEKTNLGIQVFRKLSDSIPLRLETRVKIDYSGNNKELELGKVLPEGFKLNQGTSDLKLLYKNNMYYVQLISGSHFIDVHSFSNNNAQTIQTKNLFNNIDKEIWSIQTDSNIRQLSIEDVDQVDSSQANVPTDWQTLPAWNVINKISLKTEKRGLNLNSPLEMTVNRTSWYGFNKETLTSLDSLQLNNKDNQYISTNKSNQKIEFFKINNVPQLIVLKDNQPTVLLPNGQSNAEVQSTSSVKEDISVFLFEGIQNISNWEIKMAPRNRLFATRGVNEATGSWIDSWNLYSLFFLFIVVFSFYKLMGKHIAVLAGVSLIFFQSNVIFSWSLWVPLLILMSLLVLIPPKHTEITKLIKGMTIFLLVLITLTVVMFIPQEIRSMINPIEDINSTNGTHFTITAITTILYGIIIYLIYILFKRARNNFVGFKQKKISSIFIFIMMVILFIGVESSYNSKSTVFKNESTITNIDPRIELSDRAKITSFAPIPSSINSKNTLRENVVKRNVVDEKVQVGAGTPSWNYYNNININVDNTANNIHLYFVSPWLVNIAGIIQILLLLTLLYNVAIYVIFAYGRNNWINKIPPKLINNKITQEFIKNIKDENNVK